MGKTSKKQRTKAISKTEYLPKDFESLELVKSFRKCLLRGLELNKAKGSLSRTEIKLPERCTKEIRCYSGLCPICHRLFRLKFLKFCSAKYLFERDWVQITIRRQLWTMKGGDFQPFYTFMGQDRLKNVREIVNLTQTFSRHHAKKTNQEPLLIVGSVETTYDITNSSKVQKPFHVHLMVSGLSLVEINKVTDKLSRKLRKLEPDLPRPVDVRNVGPKVTGAKTALSYVIKQPYWRVSKNEKNPRGRKQSPKPNDFAELANNFGPLKLSGLDSRIYFKGLEFRRGKFQFSK